MQINSRELLRQVYMKKKLKITSVYKNNIQRNGYQTRPRGDVKKNLCHDLEYFVDNVKQPFFFSYPIPLSYKFRVVHCLNY